MTEIKRYKSIRLDSSYCIQCVEITLPLGELSNQLQSQKGSILPHDAIQRT